jgi:hypothetical protein
VPVDLVGRCFNCLRPDPVAAARSNATRCLRCHREGHQAGACKRPRSPDSAGQPCRQQRQVMVAVLHLRQATSCLGSPWVWQIGRLQVVAPLPTRSLPQHRRGRRRVTFCLPHHRSLNRPGISPTPWSPMSQGRDRQPRCPRCLPISSGTSTSRSRKCTFADKKFRASCCFSKKGRR